MAELNEMVEVIHDKESFLQFIAKLSEDLKLNQTAWGNRDLGSFLEAMGSWIEDMDGYYINCGIEAPKSETWRFFADALMAARIYE
ncbi:MAG: hypothetical protein QM796_18650 [Chthoniobacteraceae bacterium]